LGQLISLLLFLIDVLQAFLYTNFLFLFDLFLLQLSYFCFLYQFLQELLLDCLQTVILTLLFTIQLLEGILFFINIFSDSSGTQKFTFLFYRLLVLLAKFYHLIQENQFLVILVEFMLEFQLGFSVSLFELTTYTQLVLTSIRVLTLQLLQELLLFLLVLKSLADLQQYEVVQEILPIQHLFLL